jgi:hypothetical protein
MNVDYFIYIIVERSKSAINQGRWHYRGSASQISFEDEIVSKINYYRVKID